MYQEQNEERATQHSVILGLDSAGLVVIAIGILNLLRLFRFGIRQTFLVLN